MESLARFLRRFGGGPARAGAGAIGAAIASVVLFAVGATAQGVAFAALAM
jgi:hypothetical protein